MTTQIHVIGSLMIDRVVRVRALPRAGETVAARSSEVFPGGKGANQAAAAARCGARVRMLGRTSAEGAFIADELEAAGVDVSSVDTTDPCAGCATVMVDDGGENAIIIASESNTRIVKQDVERFLASAKHNDIVALQNECAHLMTTIGAASARGLRVWLNAAPADAADLLHDASHGDARDESLHALRYEKLSGLVVNETEAEALTGVAEPSRALELLARRMPRGIVIITLGAKGAIAAHGEARYEHRGFVVKAVDTVGCGDAFVGAFLAAHAQGLSLPESLARGNAAGAIAAMREGAMPSLPSCEEVDAAAVFPEGTRLNARAGQPFDEMPRFCQHCHYDLAGRRVGDACPECGTTISRLALAGALGHSRARMQLRVAAYGLLLAAVIPSFILATGASTAVLEELGLPSQSLLLRLLKSPLSVAPMALCVMFALIAAAMACLVSLIPHTTRMRRGFITALCAFVTAFLLQISVYCGVNALDITRWIGGDANGIARSCKNVQLLALAVFICAVVPIARGAGLSSFRHGAWVKRVKQLVILLVVSACLDEAMTLRSLAFDLSRFPGLRALLLFALALGPTLALAFFGIALLRLHREVHARVKS